MTRHMNIPSFARCLAMAAAVLLAGSCSKDLPSGDGDETRTLEYVNLFAYNTMRTYYLWADEVKDGLDDWKQHEADPVAKVQSLRYKDENGKPVDKWTQLYEDFDAFYNSVTGTRKSYGFSYKLYYGNQDKTRIVAVVTYTYADGPARKAGLQRGDVIAEVNGTKMTPDNYAEIASEQLHGGDKVTLTMGDGSKKTLTAVEMYENPVQLARVFDLGDKKVGYLHYTSFTLDSCEELIQVCRSFREQQIDELILDLRYNSGGYAFTEVLLASMLAPEADVTAGKVLATEVFNSLITGVLGKQETLLSTKHAIKSDGQETVYDTEGANLNISHLYAIVDDASASASESLLCELFPYLDITLVGSQTRGKYCSGLMIRATKWYEDNAKELGEKAEGKDYVGGWGIYVMYSRFADRDGVTRCMPDGLTPDYSVTDNPGDGYQLGDPKETMLAATLALIRGTAPAALQRSQEAAPVALPTEQPAVRIITEPRPAGPGFLR